MTKINSTYKYNDNRDHILAGYDKANGDAKHADHKFRADKLVREPTFYKKWRSQYRRDRAVNVITSDSDDVTGTSSVQSIVNLSGGNGQLKKWDHQTYEMNIGEANTGKKDVKHSAKMKKKKKVDLSNDKLTK